MKEERSLFTWEREEALQKLSIISRDNERLNKEKNMIKENLAQEKEKLISERDSLKQKYASAIKEVEYSERQLADAKIKIEDSHESQGKKI